MHEQIEALRKRVDDVSRGPDGRRRFTAAIRKDARGIAKKWLASGRKLAVLADALDLHKSLLRTWVNEGEPRGERVKPVRVARTKAKQSELRSARRELVAVLPCGIRIEGLEISEVIELASVLR